MAEEGCVEEIIPKGISQGDGMSPLTATTKIEGSGVRGVLDQKLNQLIYINTRILHLSLATLAITFSFVGTWRFSSFLGGAKRHTMWVRIPRISPLSKKRAMGWNSIRAGSSACRSLRGVRLRFSSLPEFKRGSLVVLCADRTCRKRPFLLTLHALYSLWDMK